MNEFLARLRYNLDKVWALDTAAPGTNVVGPHGHCAAVAWLIHGAFGGELYSIKMNGISHWYNRIHVGNQSFDVDITGDQFFLPKIQIKPAGFLYDGLPRLPDEVNEETRARALLLRDRLISSIKGSP